MPIAKKIIYIPTSKAVCSGDENSPHPRVYLTTVAEGFVDCPYCGQRFVRKEDACDSAEH
jgi:uncharacterized Zn-finger protein